MKTYMPMHAHNLIPQSSNPYKRMISKQAAIKRSAYPLAMHWLSLVWLNVIQSSASENDFKLR
jgi:hypothetical protein